MPIWTTFDSVASTIYRRVCPLFSFDSHNRVFLTGSGVPFNSGGFRFLLTAAHVCFDSNNTPIPLFTFGREQPVALLGRRGAWAYNRGRSPDADVAVIELDFGLAEDLEGYYQFATPHDTGVIQPKNPSIQYLITGYPAVRNKVKSLSWLPSLATFLMSGDIRNVEPFQKFDKTNDHHFAVHVSNTKIVTSDGGHFRMPTPHGMSGGGVWLVELDERRRLITSPVLVGVGIEYHKSTRMFVATRVQTAIPLVWDLKKFSEQDRNTVET